MDIISPAGSSFGLVLLSLGLAAALAAVLRLLARQRSEYGRHVQQLQPGAKEKRSAAGPRVLRSDITRDEVARHNRADDAWIIVRNKRTKELRVYDVTEYVSGWAEQCSTKLPCSACCMQDLGVGRWEAMGRSEGEGQRPQTLEGSHRLGCALL
jgi:hypothetical protein